MKASFEDKIDIINEAIAKRRNKWRLSSLADIDFDDISQIIRLHIYTKWSLWDQSRPIENWLNRVISHQLLNLIRNNYGNLAPPCADCACNQGGDLCGLTASGKKCSECPLYARWQRSKETGYNLKFPKSIDVPETTNSLQYSASLEDNVDFEKAANRLHEHMQGKLSAFHYKVYKMLFIDNKSEKETAKSLGYKTTEKGRFPGYKQIHNLKKELISRVKKELENMDPFYD